MSSQGRFPLVFRRNLMDHVLKVKQISMFLTNGYSEWFKLKRFSDQMSKNRCLKRCILKYLQNCMVQSNVLQKIFFENVSKNFQIITYFMLNNSLKSNSLNSGILLANSSTPQWLGRGAAFRFRIGISTNSRLFQRTRVFHEVQRVFPEFKFENVYELKKASPATIPKIYLHFLKHILYK